MIDPPRIAARDRGEQRAQPVGTRHAIARPRTPAGESPAWPSPGHRAPPNTTNAMRAPTRSDRRRPGPGSWGPARATAPPRASSMTAPLSCRPGPPPRLRPLSRQASTTNRTPRPWHPQRTTVIGRLGVPPGPPMRAPSPPRSALNDEPHCHHVEGRHGLAHHAQHDMSSSTMPTTGSATRRASSSPLASTATNASSGP